jgi:lambda family phage portal protein
MGFFSDPETMEHTGDEDLADWEPTVEADPGTFERLPAGVEFKDWDPDHPATAFEAFVLAVLRGASSGLGTSYVSLSGDLRGVSYSSIRQGNLDDRDFWRTLQTWTVEHFTDRVYRDWLKMSLLTQAVPLPPGKYDKFCAPVWRPRGWPWVDPLKEVNANEKAIQGKQRSLQAVLGEQGIDIEEILIDNQIAEEIAEKFGTTLPLLNGSTEEKTNATQTLATLAAQIEDLLDQVNNM